jgi:hypothetical protein
MLSARSRKPSAPEIDLHLAEERDEREDVILDALEDGVEEARHHLAVAEAIAAEEHLDLGEPPAKGREHEGVVSPLAQRAEVEAAHAPVGADADGELERGEVLVVVEEVGHRAISLRGADGGAEFAQAGEARRAPSKEDAMWSRISLTIARMSSWRRTGSSALPTVAPSSAARRRTRRRRSARAAGATRATVAELADDAPPEIGDGGIAGRMGEDPEEEAPAHHRFVTADAHAEAAGHELVEEEVRREARGSQVEGASGARSRACAKRPPETPLENANERAWRSSSRSGRGTGSRRSRLGATISVRGVSVGVGGEQRGRALSISRHGNEVHSPTKPCQRESSSEGVGRAHGLTTARPRPVG